MLFTSEQIEGIRAGRITLTFRRWKRPQARAGRFQRTAAGMIRIDAVDVVSANGISEEDSQRSGFRSKAELLHWLGDAEEVYRVAFHREGSDERLTLQRTLPTSGELEALKARLARMDDGSPWGAWTVATLGLIRAYPGRRAADLAKERKIDVATFKKDVRRLKALGLTISLEVGYRLSPRGESVLGYL